MPAEQIMLGDVVAAVDGIEFLNKCVTGFAECSDEYPCPLHPYWKEIRVIISRMLNEKNVAGLSKGIDIKIGLLDRGYSRRRTLRSV